MGTTEITSIITLRAPAYAGDSRLSDLIDLALSEFSATVLGGQYDKAVALLVMHWLAKEGISNAAAGPVVSEKEGDLARSYAKPLDTDDLNTTTFGQELKRLIESNVFTPMNRMSGYST